MVLLTSAPGVLAHYAKIIVLDRILVAVEPERARTDSNFADLSAMRTPSVFSIRLSLRARRNR